MKNKNSKARMQVIFGILLFTLILFAELYTMINLSEMFIVMIVFAVLDLGCLYVVVSGFLAMKEQKELRQEEQYDSIFKSEKASYLMLKKYFEEIEDKLNYLESASKIPTEEIVNAQKGIAKVIINRNRENAEALMSSNDQVTDQIDSYGARLDELAQAIQENRNAIEENREAVETIIGSGREAILEGQKSISTSNDKSLQMREQDIIVNLKDMELRLNSAIMQSQRVVAQAPVMTAPVQQEIPSPVAEPVVSSEPIPEPIIEPEPVVEAEPVAEPELIAEPEAVAEPEPIAEVEPELVVEAEPIAEPELEPIVEAVEEEKPPMPDLSDPNKVMSPDDIAALFANMGGGETATPEPEPMIEPEPMPVEEEKPPMPDLSDPNKTLSPDDIAALFANLGA